MNDTISILGQQIPVALLLVYLQNWAKKQSWLPWLNYQSARMNHLFAIIASGVAVFGVHTAHAGTLTSGASFTITLPPLAVLLSGIYHWLTQYIMSKTAYTALQSQLNPPAAQQPTPVVVMPGSKAMSAPPVNTGLSNSASGITLSTTP